jgi:hypothetical protein
MNKLIFPPKIRPDEFDKDFIAKEVAIPKLQELEQEWVGFEKDNKDKEPIYYSQLKEAEEYGEDWFMAMINIYSIEKKREFYKKWYRYWDRLTGKDEEVSFDGSLDQESLEKIRDYPIEDLIETETKPAGAGRIKTFCPFHEERTPSFFIYDDNSFHCFGCQKHGNNAIDFLMAQGLDFKEAISKLS